MSLLQPQLSKFQNSQLNLQSLSVDCDCDCKETISKLDVADGMASPDWLYGYLIALNATLTLPPMPEHVESELRRRFCSSRLK